MRISDVMAVTGLRSRQSITVWFVLVAFPSPLNLASAWRASDVFRFIESCQEDPLGRPPVKTDSGADGTSIQGICHDGL
jgi:predicted DNA-binding transcriptional regulator AlpA